MSSRPLRPTRPRRGGTRCSFLRTYHQWTPPAPIPPSSSAPKPPTHAFVCSLRGSQRSWPRPPSPTCHSPQPVPHVHMCSQTRLVIKSGRWRCLSRRPTHPRSTEALLGGWRAALFASRSEASPSCTSSRPGDKKTLTWQGRCLVVPHPSPPDPCRPMPPLSCPPTVLPSPYGTRVFAPSSSLH